MPQETFVIKRNGEKQKVSFDKVIRRLDLLASGKHKNAIQFADPLEVNIIPVAQKVIDEIHDGVTTKRLDEYAAEVCASMVLEHPDYSILAGRIIISNHQKTTPSSFTDIVKNLYQNKDKSGAPSPLLLSSFYKTVLEHEKELDSMIDDSRDFLINWFGFKTLERSYLLKTSVGNNRFQERPQHMYLRVAVALHGHNLDLVKETYDLLSLQKLSHASPTLYNSGTPIQQMSSCFLLSIEDSLEGIYSCLFKTAMISKLAGGIGIGVSDVRAKGSLIRKTGGLSDGLVPMLRTFNETGRYVNQGGKRKGSIAIYLEPHHADIEDFLDLRKTHGKEEMRCRDLFTALWISDLFMKRLMEALADPEKDVLWSLFCPDEAKGLTDVYGDEYEELYLKYEKEGIYRKQVKIIDLWHRILESQKETGTPYMLYKDCVNYRNPQKNIGIIKNSNLCAEVTLVQDPKDDTIAVCNLAAMPLPSFVDQSGPEPRFDFEELGRCVKVAIRNLNRVIDVNYYPVEDCKKSNTRDRPVGLGVIGLYDTFCLMGYSFDSEEARDLNKKIFETIYYHSVEMSMELAIEEGPYEMFAGSPASQGKLQIDLWNEDRVRFGHEPTELSGMYDWASLRAKVVEHGMRNSTLTTIVPSASTSNIIGMTESMECITQNVYVRQVLSCDYKIVNKHLQNDLIKRGLWTKAVRDEIVAKRGSIRDIDAIPEEVKNFYKTAFEVKQKDYLNLAIDRSPFVDLTQSLNIFVDDPNDELLTNIQRYAWKNRLKTGMYYLRRNPIAHRVQFTVKPKNHSAPTGATGSSAPKEEEEVPLCRLNDPTCTSCSV